MAWKFFTNQGAQKTTFAPAAMTMLSDVVLGSDTATFDFTSIPATYKDLQIRIFVRTSIAAINDAINLRFNNDSAGNYDSEAAIATGTTFFGTEGLAATQMRIGSCPGNNATAGYFATVVIDINSYASTTGNKQASGTSSYAYGTSTGQIENERVSGIWRTVNTAISRITVIAGGNFKTGSRATLYGIA